MRNAAEIYAEVDGTPGAGDMPGRLVFGTTADGASSPTERMRIDSSGNVGIGTTNPGAPLDISGDNGSGRVARFVGVNGGSFQIQNVSNNLVGIGATGAGDELALLSSNTERARIDSSGRLLVGTSSARSNLFNTTATAQLQSEGTTNDTSTACIVQNNSAGTDGPRFVLGKSNGSTVGSNTVVSNGNGMGVISFQGNDGTEFVEGASIKAQVDGTPSANVMPGRLVFSTTAAGASSPTERVRIGSAGQIGLGGANYGTSGQVLTSNGSSSAPTWQDAGGGSGAWTLLSTTTASSASTVDITSDIDSTYRTYVIIGSEVVASTDTNLNLRFYDNGTLNTSSEYDYNHVRLEGVQLSDNQAENADAVNLTNGTNAGVGRGANMVEIVIDNPSASKTQYKARYEIASDQGGDLVRVMGVLAMQKGSAYTNVDGVRLYPSSGTLSGTFKLYGIT
jgi:hypothetical protein